MNNENQTSRVYLPMKNEVNMTEHAVRLMKQVTNRFCLEALCNPQSDAEKRVANAYNNELAAHQKALDFKNKSKKDGWAMTSYQERVRAKNGYWGDGGHFHMTCFANGKELSVPFGPDLYLGECSKENLERAKYYAMGIVIGMCCKYKRPQIVLTWENKGVGTVLHSVNK